MTSELIPYSTIDAMAKAWERSTAEIKTALQTLKDANERLRDTFGPYMTYDRSALESLDEERLLKELRQCGWRYVIEKSEIRRVLSIARAKEFDHKLEHEELPNITLEEIEKILLGVYANAPEFAEEMVTEVFELFRPHLTPHKTTLKFEAAIGDRVVLPCYVEMGYGSKKFRVRYYRDNDIRAINNVFQALDGKGFASTYHGELQDAIEQCDGTGESTYFKFKCFKNGNLHLQFKRMDLVAKMNAIVKERSLTPANNNGQETTL